MKSNHRGVAWSNAARKWRAYVNVLGKRQIHVGLYESESEAAEMARIGRKILHIDRRPKAATIGSIIILPLVAANGSVREYATIDVEDSALAELPWRLHSNGYVQSEVGRKSVYLHRLVVGLKHGDPREADHKNRNRLDNRRANLRVVTRAQNTENLDPSGHRDGASDYRGVSRAQQGGWRARVRGHGHEVALGVYDTEYEAGIAAAQFRRLTKPHSFEPLLDDVIRAEVAKDV